MLKELEDQGVTESMISRYLRDYAKTQILRHMIIIRLEEECKRMHEEDKCKEPIELSPVDYSVLCRYCKGFFQEETNESRLASGIMGRFAGHDIKIILEEE